MATEAENLQTAIDQVCAKIVAVTANPRPSYGIDGQSISWGEYYSGLVKLREDLKLALINAQGPFEFHLQGSS
jgi:hypothetical protein